MHALNDALPPEPRRVRSFAALRQRAATQGVTCNGSLVLTVRLRENPAAAAR